MSEVGNVWSCKCLKLEMLEMSEAGTRQDKTRKTQKQIWRYRLLLIHGNVDLVVAAGGGVGYGGQNPFGA